MPCTLLRGSGTVFTTRLTLVSCMKLVEVHDVREGRVIAAIHPPEGFQRLSRPPNASGRSPVHVHYLPAFRRMETTPDR